VGTVKGAEPPQRADAAGLQKKGDAGKRSPSSLSHPPTQWVYDGRDLCGRVEVIEGTFVAVDHGDAIIGKFRTLREATRSFPAGGAP
jgi:hypothetical protein